MEVLDSIIRRPTCLSISGNKIVSPLAEGIRGGRKRHRGCRLWRAAKSGDARRVVGCVFLGGTPTSRNPNCNGGEGAEQEPQWCQGAQRDDAGQNVLGLMVGRDWRDEREKEG